MSNYIGDTKMKIIRHRFSAGMCKVEFGSEKPKTPM